MTTKDLKTTELNEYFIKYIDKVPKDINLIEGFKIGAETVIDFFKSLPNSKLEYKYAQDKWTIKEILQHLIDTERIFMYRCFRIARHDKTALAGFDQNIYIKPSLANQKTIETLLEEFSTNRQNSIAILQSLRAIDLEFIGKASNNTISARAIAFTIIGHDIWHIDVIKERYL